MNQEGDLILPHGGYRKVRSFVLSLAAYDGTRIFCDRFIDRRSRTHDRMVQAARSGVQNIAEGLLASGTSIKTELKLTKVARASLGELIRDYEDYLRQNGLARWDKESVKVRAMRARLAGNPSARSAQAQSDEPDKINWSDLGSRPPVFDEPVLAALAALRVKPAEVGANILLCLSHQASYLLARQSERLERGFIERVRFTERLYRYRNPINSDRYD